MFPNERQQKLDPILAELRLVEGIEGVWQDDFDSTGINVFFNLIPLIKNNGKVMVFELPHQKIKRRLKKLFRGLDVEFRVTDYPKMQYEKNPLKYNLFNEPKNIKIGYDQTRYGIEVFV
jgi:hypothetical protein